MKITLNQLLSSKDSLSELLKVKMNIEKAYELNRLVKKLQPELDLFNEQKNALFKELGEENTETKRITIKPENSIEFDEKINSLLNHEIEIDWIPMKVSDLAGSTIEPKNLVDWIFE